MPSWPRFQNGIKTQIHVDFEFTVNSLTKCSLHLYHKRILILCSHIVGLVWKDQHNPS